VTFDRYEGFPAQDAADASEVINMLDGDQLEKAIKKYVPSPDKPHAIYLEIERCDTMRVFKLGVEQRYKVVSTPKLFNKSLILSPIGRSLSLPITSETIGMELGGIRSD
jgi:formate-dependent phosphoribosylglycinamide formyltransferase (GAR transformylase)